MIVKASPLGWKFYAAVIVVFVVAVFSINPSLDKNPLIKIKNSFSNYAVVQLGLSGLKPQSYTGLLGNIIKQTSKGQIPATTQTIKIHIAFKHKNRIEAEREQAIRVGILTNARNYPARVVINGDTFPATIRLKGDLSDHWIGPSRWSFRIRLKDGRAAMGLNTFSIHKPPSRQIPADNIFQTWLRAAGNITPRHDYARVYFNGDDWGVMNVEEHMSKEILEHNQNRESPILKIGSEDNWHFSALKNKIHVTGTLYGRFGFHLYNDRKYADDHQHLQLFSYAGHAFRAFLRNERSVEEVFEIDALSRAVIASLIWQNTHGVSLHNMRLNLNPFTLKLLPVTTDQGDIQPILQDTSLLRSSFSPFMAALLRSEAFYTRLSYNLAKLKAAIPSMYREQERICSVFAFDCPRFNFALFEKNFKTIEDQGGDYFRTFATHFKTSKTEEAISNSSTPPSEAVQHVRHVEPEYYTDGRLVLWNILPHDIWLESARLYCKAPSTCDPSNLLEAPIKIRAGFDGILPAKTIVSLPKNLQLNKMQELRIITSLGEAKLSERITIALPYSQAQHDTQHPTIIDLSETLKFLRIEGTNLRIVAGDWSISEPIIIPKGYNLRVEAGTTLRFSPEAYILSEATIIAKGRQDAPIRFTAKSDADTWGGIMVLNTPDRSVFEHVIFENTRAFSDDARKTTGAITFYQSNMEMRHVVFKNNIAEDALNTVRSTFDMQDVTFSHTASDAFDSDFSRGRISNSIFQNIAGDGLDTSGSNVSGNSLIFRDIGDKAVSIGEASTVSLREIDIADTHIGIAAKDGSQLQISDAKILRFKAYGAMAYIKKEAYGPARLSMEQVNLLDAEVLNQTGNKIILNGRLIPGQSLDVQTIY